MNNVLAASLGFLMLGAQTQQVAEPGSKPETVAQQAIPDAPKPQTTLPNPTTIAPGKGTPQTTEEQPSQASGQTSEPAASAPAAASAATQSDNFQQPPVEELPPGEGIKAMTLRVQVNFVQVPFTVKDSKGQLVPGLTWRDVHVYENGLRQVIDRFTADPSPLSVALVIDQSMTQDNMTRVNDSLGAIPAAFAPYDEVAVFTYNNGPRTVTPFTGSQSARLVQAIEQSKSSGREALLAGSLGGPLAQTNVINDQNFDPNTAPVRGHTGMQLDPPKEVHTLNDAILAAATALSKAARGRRRVIYVISDGKEYGSTAKYKDVVKYLQMHEIAVYGTLVGDSSLPVIGFFDRVHLPLTMRDNILPAYALATGGEFDAEFRTGAMEKSFAKIAEQVRTQYMLGYYTHEPFIDGKYRKLEVKVLRPNLQVIAKAGYWPSGEQAQIRPTTTPAQ
jgi:VWFA-related protein